MKKEAIPSLGEVKYNCPYCGTYCPQYHYKLNKTVFDLIPTVSTQEYTREPRFLGDSKQLNAKIIGHSFAITTCAECKGLTFWHNHSMVYPNVSNLPKPLEDMPKEIKELYIEATDVFPISAKSASALLRLAIELLLEQLGEKGNLNAKIKSLVGKGVSQKIQQGLDAVRWYGNKGVHPGEIDLEEKREDVIFLFHLLNIIVQELITDVKETEKFYKRLPSKFIEQISNRDS